MNALAPVVQLVCVDCGAAFVHPVQRGRRPRRCGACRAPRHVAVERGSGDDRRRVRLGVCELCGDSFEAAAAGRPGSRCESCRAGRAGDGFELWRGLSMIDRTPIGVVVTHVRKDPQQRKIGRMAQAWILPLLAAPLEVVRTGDDRGVCGSCRFRRTVSGGCYVSIAQAPQRVWYAWRTFRSYHRAAPADVGALRGRQLRIGAWGDPGAVPVEVWRRLLDVVPGHTAYTHRWRELRASGWASWCTASVDSPAEAAEAQARGWRTFRARTAEQPLLAGERTCPAASEAPTYGRVACSDCRLCAGSDRRGPNVAILVHGQASVRADRTITEVR